MVYCKCGFIDLAIFDMNSKKGDLNCKNPKTQQQENNKLSLRLKARHRYRAK